MKLWEKVNNLTAYDSKSRVIIEFLNQSGKFLVGSLPEKYLWSISAEDDKIIAIYRFSGTKKRIAGEVPDTMAYSFDEAISVNRATKMFPKYYRLADKIYIKPDPDYNAYSGTKTYTDIDGNSVDVIAGGGDKGIIIYAVPPLVTENTETWILVEFEHVSILYAASLDAKRKADLAAVDEDFELAQVYQAQAQEFYQRSINEFQAITGGLAATPDKQETQRREDRRST